MILTTKTISDQFSSCQQLTVDQVAEAAAAGFKTIINNRPDGEDGAEQPSSEEIRQAAEANSLQYVHIPVVPGQLTYVQVDEIGRAVAQPAWPYPGFLQALDT